MSARIRSESRNQRAGLVILLMGAVMAIGSLIWYVVAANEEREAQHWPTAAGLIEATEVARVSGRFPGYAPVVHYRYEVAGRSYRGDRIWFNPENFSDHSEAARLLESYPVGGSVQVRYDPNDPSRAVLILGSTIWPIWLGVVAGLGFALLGWATWRGSIG